MPFLISEVDAIFSTLSAFLILENTKFIKYPNMARKKYKISEKKDKIDKQIYLIFFV
jgi:hypothetical protein